MVVEPEPPRGLDLGHAGDVARVLVTADRPWLVGTYGSASPASTSPHCGNSDENDCENQAAVYVYPRA
jgi:hypothetical protein